MTEQRAVLPQTRPDLGPRFQARGAGISAGQSRAQEKSLTKHSRVEDTSHDVNRFVGRSSQDDRLLPQSRRRYLSNDGVCGWTDSTVVDEVEYDEQ
jgi:hypothetical protein